MRICYDSNLHYMNLFIYLFCRKDFISTNNARSGSSQHYLMDWSLTKLSFESAYIAGELL